MERNRFSFRRKGSGKEKKDKIDLSGFDYDTLSYISQKEAKEIVEDLLKEYSFTEDQWIELIGLSCATAIAELYPVAGLAKGKGSVLVCCGPDRNGGEGLVCARYLKNLPNGFMFSNGVPDIILYGGYRPTVYYPKSSGSSSNKALYNSRADQCEKIDIPFLLYLPSDASLITDSYNLIIDAVFGSSCDISAASEYTSVISAIVKCKVPVISIESPSGWNLNNNTPEVDEEDFLQPEVIISSLAPVFCTKHFKGKHILVGRFLPTDLSKKFGLSVPPFPGTGLWIEFHRPSAVKTPNNETTKTDDNGEKGRRAPDQEKENKEEKSSD